MKLEKGTTISHYKILSEIGKGGMGEVYLALDTRLDRKVALKVLPEEFAKDSERMGRFVREAKSASALNHPNIITIYEIAEYEGKNLIAMEFVDGKTLTDYSNSKRLQYSSALDIAIRIASALEEAHSAGIIHRDIKPDNIMVRPNGQVKILDFGIAKLTGKGNGDSKAPEAGEEDKTLIAEPAENQVHDPPMTTPGMVIGTANYMSPEQAKGKEIDARSDIFSFGVVFYEMISGRLPFSGDSPLEIISSILKDEPKSLKGSDVPAEFIKVVIKCLRKNPEERYADMSLLLSHLKEIEQELAFQDKLEKTIEPRQDLPETQLLKAETADESKEAKATEQSEKAETIQKSSFSRGLMALAGVVLVTIIGLGYWYFSGGKQIESIAVMPFVNESGNEEVEYLSDGMTETLISSLTEIPNLSVKARSTVFYYKGKIKTPKEIGNELGVEAVLLGRLVQRGDDIKLSLELVDTSTLDAIWSQSYDRKMNDLITLQSEIARNVSDKLRLKLTTSEQEKVAKTYSANSEAQQLYLKGRFYWNERANARGTRDLEKAIAYFTQATEKDPNYALAYTGLADSYAVMPVYGRLRPKKYITLSKKAAQKALELDNSLAEAHTSLAEVLLAENDWNGAGRAYKRAIELNPNYAHAHYRYASFLSIQGMHDEAIKEFTKALELDPFSQVINRVAGVFYYQARRYDEALIQLKKTAGRFPDNATVYNNLSDTYAAKGSYDLAIDSQLKAFEIQGRDQATISRYRNTYKNGGWTAFWQEQLDDRLKRVAKITAGDDSVFVKSFFISLYYARVGDKANTIKYLQRAFEANEFSVKSIKTRHDYDFLRQEPEFIELIKKIGFPE